MSESKIEIGILLIFAIYLNPIIIGGLETICYLLIYGSALLYLLIHIKYIYNCYFRQLHKKLVIPIIWIFFALFFSIIVPALHGTNDYTYINVILGMFRKAIILSFLFLLLSKRVEPDSLIETFMYYFSLVSVLYVLSSIVFTLLPMLKREMQPSSAIMSRIPSASESWNLR